jgi:hypothetical protein
MCRRQSVGLKKTQSVELFASFFTKMPKAETKQGRPCGRPPACAAAPAPGPWRTEGEGPCGVPQPRSWRSLARRRSSWTAASAMQERTKGTT